MRVPGRPDMKERSRPNADRGPYFAHPCSQRFVVQLNTFELHASEKCTRNALRFVSPPRFHAAIQQNRRKETQNTNCDIDNMLHQKHASKHSPIKKKNVFTEVMNYFQNFFFFTRSHFAALQSLSTGAELELHISPHCVIQEKRDAALRTQVKGPRLVLLCCTQ